MLCSGFIYVVFAYLGLIGVLQPSLALYLGMVLYVHLTWPKS